jgi:hypothetical protein
MKSLSSSRSNSGQRYFVIYLLVIEVCVRIRASLWNLLWTKLHCDRISGAVSLFSQSMSFHQRNYSHFIYLSPRLYSLNNRQLCQVKHFLCLWWSPFFAPKKYMQTRPTAASQFIQRVLEILMHVHLRCFVFCVLLHSADCATHQQSFCQSVCLPACLPARLHRYFDKVV